MAPIIRGAVNVLHHFSRLSRRSGLSRGYFTPRAGFWLTMRQGCADRPVERYRTCLPAVVPLPGSADVTGRLAMRLATV